MKRILLLMALVLAGFGFVSISRGADLFASLDPSITPDVPPTPPHQAPVSAPPLQLKPLPDADALAARTKAVNDIYTKVRDDALAAYAKAHPQSQPYDDDARATLRLLAYLSVHGDFYGECLWQQADHHAESLMQRGNTDPIWPAMRDVYYYVGHLTVDDASTSDASKRVFNFTATDYPALLKCLSYQTGISNILEARSQAKPPLTRALDDLPKLANGAVQNFAQLISSHLPHDALYLKGAELLKAAQDDGPTLQLLSDGIDKAFTSTDPGNPIAGVLLGDFYADFAWTARGSGWANTVTPEGWRLMADRLERAENILTENYNKYPAEYGTAKVMMSVVLGREQPREQMELWFQRGIKANPDAYSMYDSKRYYLLPRWYGSDEIVWNFGLECAKSDNWAAKIPMILVEAIDDAGKRDPSVYARPEIWGPVEKVYRAYLDHYPTALRYRTRFFKCAVEGGHWDVAAEQLKFLSDDYDRDLLEPKDYVELAQQTQANAAPGK